MSAPIFDPETGEVIETADQDAAPSPKVMSLDDARALIVREHGVAVSKEDPLLMAVTLHQGFSADLAHQLAEHDASVKRLLDATGNAYAETVEQVLESLKDKTVKASLDHAFALVERQEQAMEQLRQTLKRHRRIIAVLTGLSWAAGILAIVILFSILR